MRLAVWWGAFVWSCVVSFRLALCGVLPPARGSLGVVCAVAVALSRVRSSVAGVCRVASRLVSGWAGCVVAVPIGLVCVCRRLPCRAVSVLFIFLCWIFLFLHVPVACLLVSRDCFHTTTTGGTRRGGIKQILENLELVLLLIMLSIMVGLLLAPAVNPLLPYKKLSTVS